MFACRAGPRFASTASQDPSSLWRRIGRHSRAIGRHRNPGQRRSALRREHWDALFLITTRRPPFQVLSESRKRSRRLILNKIVDASGHEPVKLITKATIQKGMDRRAATPAAANEFLKSMRAVLDYLVGVDELKENPAKLVKYNSIKTDFISGRSMRWPSLWSTMA